MIEAHTFPFVSLTSLRIFWSLSSNEPRTPVPAMIEEISKDTIRLFFMASGTSPLTILCAMPYGEMMNRWLTISINSQHTSTMEVLPTPASPMRAGLFFVLRHKTYTILWLSIGKYFKSTVNLCISSNDRVQLSRFCLLSQVDSILEKHFAFGNGIWTSPSILSILWGIVAE